MTISWKSAKVAKRRSEDTSGTSGEGKEPTVELLGLHDTSHELESVEVLPGLVNTDTRRVSQRKVNGEDVDGRRLTPNRCDTKWSQRVSSEIKRRSA